MRKRGRIKYILIISICLFIFIYGFIMINVEKPNLVKEKSKFTISLKLSPFDFRIDTKNYTFYINNKIFNNIREKCINTYNNIITK